LLCVGIQQTNGTFSIVETQRLDFTQKLAIRDPQLQDCLRTIGSDDRGYVAIRQGLKGRFDLKRPPASTFCDERLQSSQPLVACVTVDLSDSA
jgi:hypothetical protein